MTNEQQASFEKLMKIFYGVWECVEAGMTLEATIAKFEKAAGNQTMIDLITSAYEKATTA